MTNKKTICGGLMAHDAKLLHRGLLRPALPEPSQYRFFVT